MVLGCQGVDKLLRTVLNILISLSLDKVTHKAPPTPPGVTVHQQESACTSDRFSRSIGKQQQLLLLLSRFSGVRLCATP